MDPVERINPEADSTFALALEAQARGFAMHHYLPRDLNLAQGKLTANARKLKVSRDAGRPLALGAPETLDLASMDVILMRQDPPFDMAYITATHLLEHVSGKVLVVNDPVSVRNAPEKLFATHFVGLMPETLISSDAGSIRAFRKKHGNIVIPAGALTAPTATTNMALNLNLDAAATVGTPDASFSSPIQVVDSLGTTHVLTVNFTETAANTWSYNVTIPGADVTGGTAGTPFPLAGATGTLTFNSSGNLITPAPPPPATNGVVPIAIPGLTDGAKDMAINWALYTPTGQPNITQYAQPSATASNTQDGLQAAGLVHVTLTNGGQIIAQYSNGEQSTIAQISLASISNPDTLVAEGQNSFQLGPGTAPPAVGVPQTGGRGQVLGGSLESSTVDIATEFTRLIVFQRSYEANAKVITTTDTLTQDTINLKQ
jgi:flagellar hook-basal body protein